MDKHLTAMMIDDCLNDPVFAARLILGFKRLPPHEELRLWGMWTSKFMIDNSGFGTAKSLCTMITIALRCALMEERVAGMISFTFDQAKTVFSRDFARWAETCPILNSQICRNRYGEPDIHHGASAWEVNFINGSKIRLIPPDFKGESERAGSEDWTDGYFDEVTKYPNIDTFNRQFITRIRKPVTNPGNPIFDRHTFLAGTARAITHPFYKVFVENVLQEMAQGNRQFMYMSFNYLDIPEEYHDLIDVDTIKWLLKTLPRDRAEQEVMGRWTHDTTVYYSPTDIAQARLTPAPILTRCE